jgi:membrane protein YdbS with pleckstrin-like domain
MTDAPRAVADDEVPWRALPDAARGLLIASGALAGFVLGVPAWFALVAPWHLGFLLGALGFIALPVIGAAVGGWVGFRRWRALRWRLDARGLQVRSGRMFQHEVFVPRSRVQHLDLERGPFERRLGLATIVVHTAGSRLQAIRQSGLAEADAVALRDALVPGATADGDDGHGD